MKLLSSTDDTAQVELSLRELRLISNTLNEVCNGINIEDAEFATRLGETRDYATKLLEEVSTLLSLAEDTT